MTGSTLDPTTSLENGTARPRFAKPSPARHRPKKRRGALLTGLVLAALAAAAYGILRPDPVAVDLAPAVRGPLEVTVDEDGRTRIRDRYVIAAPVSATLLRVTREVGDTVHRGEVLARLVPLSAPMLDPRVRAETQARLAAALAVLEQARAAARRSADAAALQEREAERLRALLARGAVPVQQSEQADVAARSAAEEAASARSGVQAAEAAVAMHRATLTALRSGAAGGEIPVRSPIDGVILTLRRESEGPVQAGEPLLEVGDPAALEAVVDLLTADAAQVRVGAAVLLERWGGDSALRGHVHRIEPAGFTRISALGVEEQRVNVIVDLDAPREAWEGLGDGFRIEARIRIWAAPDVLTVPANATFRSGDGWAVFRVEAGRARMRPVSVGQRTAARVELTEGLAPGDTVISYPGEKVSDGVRVVAREAR